MPDTKFVYEAGHPDLALGSREIEGRVNVRFGAAEQVLSYYDPFQNPRQNPHSVA